MEAWKTSSTSTIVSAHRVSPSGGICSVEGTYPSTRPALSAAPRTAPGPIAIVQPPAECTASPSRPTWELYLLCALSSRIAAKPGTALPSGAGGRPQLPFRSCDLCPAETVSQPSIGQVCGPTVLTDRAAEDPRPASRARLGVAVS